MYISIHAPTRGATRPNGSVRRLSIHFNPRSHERSDVFFALCNGQFLCISIHAPTRGATVCTVPRTWIPVFQSTLPREERRFQRVFLRINYQHFNPRSHERSDPVSCDLMQNYFSISIHAPTRGATIITTMHKTVV